MGNIVNLARRNPANIAMASTFVQEAIAKDKVVIFSKTYCPYCTMAKEVSDFGILIIYFAWIESERHSWIKNCALKTSFIFPKTM